MEYAMKNQYVFTLKKTAVAAEKYISNFAGFPQVRNNAKTGKAAPNKQKTTKWANVYKRATDGKYYFEKLADSDFEDVPVDVVEKFRSDYPHTIEEKQSDWVPDD